MQNTNERTTAVDAPQFSFSDVQRFTGMSKSDLQNYSRYIPPAEKATGRGNRSKYSARNIFCFFIFDQLSRMGVPVSIAHEWATTSFVMGDIAYAWFVVPGSQKGKPPIGIEHMYEDGENPGWEAIHGGPDRGFDFAYMVTRYMDEGEAFMIVPTRRIFDGVCQMTGTAPE